MVIQVLDASFDVLVVKYGIVKRVYTSVCFFFREINYEKMQVLLCVEYKFKLLCYSGILEVYKFHIS